MELLQPRSVIDVGCAVGTWLSVFREQGVEDVFGIDGDYVDRSLLEIPSDCFQACDLTDPPNDLGRWELAVSLEVAEHLPAEHASGFVRFLTRLAPAILFSAAIPGQGGFQHINERWQSYWVKLFAACDYELINCIRPAIWDLDQVLVHYAQNSLLFVSKETLAERPELAELHDRYQDQPIDVIHPKLWNYARSFPAPIPGFRKTLKHVPKALVLAVSRRLGKHPADDV